MQYEMVGLYPAQLYFSVDKDSGVLRVIANLKDDPLRLSSYTVSQYYNNRFVIVYIYM